MSIPRPNKIEIFVDENRMNLEARDRTGGDESSVARAEFERAKKEERKRR